MNYYMLACIWRETECGRSRVRDSVTCACAHERGSPLRSAGVFVHVTKFEHVRTLRHVTAKRSHVRPARRRLEINDQR